MKAVFVETQAFTKILHDYFDGDGDYQEFQLALMENPERGDVMRGCGGLRKARWRGLRRGKGSRGGLRIIYLHVPEVSRFLLLDVYSKDEADDLEDGERKLLAALAAEYKDTAIGQARKEESR